MAAHSTRLLSSTLTSLANVNTHHDAKRESDDDTLISYHKFVAPQRKSFMQSSISSRSHYNFIHDSLPYRTTNARQLQLYDTYMNDVLSFNHIDKWQRITQCLKHDQHAPDKQLLCKALVTDFHIANEDVASAQSTIRSAYDSFVKYDDEREWHKHDREQLYVRAFYEWIVAFDQKRAQAIFRLISQQYPFDLYAAKRAQEMSFDLSDCDSMLSIFVDIYEYHSVNGTRNPLKEVHTGQPIPSAYYNGMLSFAYEQKGFLRKAEEMSLEGLQYYLDDNWLQHSLIHARYFQKNTRDDLQALIAYMVEHGSPYWDIREKHAFITTHNWWHIALLYLELDDLDAATQIVSTHVWRERLDRRADQIGALSMFWILQMVIDSKTQSPQLRTLKHAIEAQWQQAMEHVLHTNQHVDVGYKLYDVLFMRGVIEMMRIYAKNGEHEKYDAFKQCFEKRFEEMKCFCGDDSEVRQKYAGIVECMLCMYGEDVKLEKAYAILSPIIDDLNIIGGSREQRFVFDQMFIDLLLKMNASEPLKQFLQSFLSKYPLQSLEIVAS